MTEREWLAERFEDHRSHLRAVAYRMLGSVSEADDAVQEAWLRLSWSDAEARQILRGLGYGEEQVRLLLTQVAVRETVRDEGRNRSCGLSLALHPRARHFAIPTP